MLFLILGHPIVPCDSTTPGLHKTGFGMFGIENLSWFESGHMCPVYFLIRSHGQRQEKIEAQSLLYKLEYSVFQQLPNIT